MLTVKLNGLSELEKCLNDEAIIYRLYKWHQKLSICKNNDTFILTLGDA